jgi:hypothetical protein
MLQNIKDQIKFKLAKILTPEVDKKLKVNQRISTLEQEILELKQKLTSSIQKNDQRIQRLRYPCGTANPLFNSVMPILYVPD